MTAKKSEVRVEPAQTAREVEKGGPLEVSPHSLTVEASLNAAHTQTRVKLTGASPGGHKLYVIAVKPDGRREDFGDVVWDGERGDIVLPFVARWIRVMNDPDDPERVEAVIDVVQDYIEDLPPDPEAAGAVKTRS